MANPRASLSLSDTLKAEFLAAQGAETRCLFLAINPQAETINLIGTDPIVGTAEEDFGPFIEKVKAGTDVSGITMAVYRLDATQWALVSVVPDDAKPIFKMLSSSSRADIKVGLGSGLIITEQFATSADELEFAAFAKQTATESKEAMATEEINKAQAVRESEEARGLEKTEAMAGVPFKLEPATEEAILGMADNKCSFIEMFLSPDTETVTLVGTPAQSVDIAAQAASLPKDEPRYCLYRLASAEGESKAPETVFCLYSPDESKLQHKMMHAAAKNTVHEQISAKGLAVSKSCTVHGPAEFVEELAPAPVPAPATGEDSILSGTSRPAGPGRGKRRLIRKK